MTSRHLVFIAFAMITAFAATLSAVASSPRAAPDLSLADVIRRQQEITFQVEAFQHELAALTLMMADTGASDPQRATELNELRTELEAARSGDLDIAGRLLEEAAAHPDEPAHLLAAHDTQVRLATTLRRLLARARYRQDIEGLLAELDELQAACQRQMFQAATLGAESQGRPDALDEHQQSAAESLNQSNASDRTRLSAALRLLKSLGTTEAGAGKVVPHRTSNAGVTRGLRRTSRMDELSADIQSDLRATLMFSAAAHTRQLRSELYELARDIRTGRVKSAVIAELLAEIAGLIERTTTARQGTGVNGRVMGELVDLTDLAAGATAAVHPPAGAEMRSAVVAIWSSRDLLLTGRPGRETACDTAIGHLQKAMALLKEAEAKARAEEKADEKNDAADDQSADEQQDPAAAARQQEQLRQAEQALDEAIDAQKKAQAAAASPDVDTNSRADAQAAAVAKATAAADTLSGVSKPAANAAAEATATERTAEQQLRQGKSAGASQQRAADQLQSASRQLAQAKRAAGNGKKGDAPQTDPKDGEQKSAQAKDGQKKPGEKAGNPPPGEGKNPPTPDKSKPGQKPGDKGSGADLPTQKANTPSADGRFTGLPERERKVLEQSQSEKIPPEYNPLIEQYLKNLSDTPK